jgi:hypothetical protein
MNSPKSYRTDLAEKVSNKNHHPPADRTQVATSRQEKRQHPKIAKGIKTLSCTCEQVYAHLHDTGSISHGDKKISAVCACSDMHNLTKIGQEIVT